MRKLLKPFVLWLLLIAVPFQGYAAAAMMCCGSGHSSHGAQSMQKEKGAMHHLADPSDQHHDHEEGLTAATDISGHDQNGNDPSKRMAFKCGACSACSVGAAIISSTDSAFAALRFDSVQIAFVSRYFYRFVPETLERPPYRLIA